MRSIYVDLDDVVADWFSFALQHLDYDVPKDSGTMLPQDEWAKLKKIERFYLNLPLKEGARELMHWLRQHVANTPHSIRLAFLTAIPKDNDMLWAPYDKVLWVQRHFPEIPVFFGPYSVDKHKHAKPGDILIDDRPSNISEWTNAGGIGHLYTTWENCKPWLQLTLEDENAYCNGRTYRVWKGYGC